MNAIHSEQQFLDLGYGKVWYQKFFTPQTQHKTPLIFIHGGPGLESGYIINLKQIALDRPCIFYDQSGCGKSMATNPSIGWTFDHYVKELATFIDILGFEKVILFGYSWGAALATQYTFDHPARVEKLILASPYISTPHLLANYKKLAQSIGIYDTIIKHENAGTIENLEYQNALAAFFKRFVFTQDPFIFDSIVANKEISETMWGKNEFSVEGNLKDLNLIPLLNHLNLPVLFTSGKSDTMVPEYMDQLHRCTAKSSWIMFNRSAHMPHIEEEKEYCKALLEFLNA